MKRGLIVCIIATVPLLALNAQAFEWSGWTWCGSRTSSKLEKEVRTANGYEREVNYFAYADALYQAQKKCMGTKLLPVHNQLDQFKLSCADIATKISKKQPVSTEQQNACIAARACLDLTTFINENNQAPCFTLKGTTCKADINAVYAGGRCVKLSEPAQSAAKTPAPPPPPAATTPAAPAPAAPAPAAPAPAAPAPATPAPAAPTPAAAAPAAPAPAAPVLNSQQQACVNTYGKGTVDATKTFLYNEISRLGLASRQCGTRCPDVYSDLTAKTNCYNALK